MKFLIRIGLAFSFSIFFSGAVFAQSATFTVLPGTDKTLTECQKVIDDFQVTGKIPSGQTLEKAKNYKKAESDYDKAQEEIKNKSEVFDKLFQESIDAQAAMEQCINQNGAGGQACMNQEYAYIDAKKKSDEAKANLEKANKDFENAGKKFDEVGKTLTSEEAMNANTTISIRDHILGCGIKTGRISLNMLPYYVTYITNFVLGLIGLIAVLFIVVGGYFYILGGASEDKDKGKNTIKHALMGMGLALLAWTIVNVLMNAITG